jgi:glucose/arabinose dehydrogenase
MRPRFSRGGLAALCAVALAVATTAGCEPGPSGLAVTTVVSGLDHPWDMAFTPGGNMLITERSGRISIRYGGQVRRLATPTDVVATGEGGMLGIAVDPAFASNKRVYTCLQSNRSGSLDVRIARWRLNDAVTGLTDRVDILTGIPASGSTHMGCRIRFGPDGYLWVGTGDATQARAPQSPTSLGGKVLRITTDGATPAAPSGPRCTPTVTATCRASPSRPAARRTRSSTAPTVTTRSTGWCGAATTGGTPSAPAARPTTTSRGP